MMTAPAALAEAKVSPKSPVLQFLTYDTSAPVTSFKTVSRNRGSFRR